MYNNLFNKYNKICMNDDSNNDIFTYPNSPPVTAM